MRRKESKKEKKERRGKRRCLGTNCIWTTSEHIERKRFLLYQIRIDYDERSYYSS
jgi:hypothetical protein